MRIRGLRDARRRAVFQVSGDVDLAWADTLYRAVLPAIGSPDREPVLIDLARVSFLDSTGLQALVDLLQAATALGKDLVLVDPSERVQRVLELAGMTSYFRQQVSGPDSSPPRR